MSDSMSDLVVLWRVVSKRDFDGQYIRHTKWFATEAAARQHVAWIGDGRGEVLSIAGFVPLPSKEEGGRE